MCASSPGVKTRRFLLIPCIHSLHQVSGSPANFPASVRKSTECWALLLQTKCSYSASAGGCSCWALQGNRLHGHREEQRKKMPREIYLSGENIAFLAASESLPALFFWWREKIVWVWKLAANWNKRQAKTEWSPSFLLQLERGVSQRDRSLQDKISLAANMYVLKWTERLWHCATGSLREVKPTGI